jgi:hypothetical protein
VRFSPKTLETLGVFGYGEALRARYRPRIRITMRRGAAITIISPISA